MYIGTYQDDDENENHEQFHFFCQTSSQNFRDYLYANKIVFYTWRLYQIFFVTYYSTENGPVLYWREQKAGSEAKMNI